MNKTWIVVIVVAIVAGAWWLNKGSSDLSLSPDTSTSPTPVGATKTPAVSKATPKASPTVTSSLSYTQLVAQYGSNRIQFDQDCHGTPGSMVLKSGTSILLDNRSNKTQVISLNGASYTLVPYGYRVVTVSSSPLPKDVGVSCNGVVNAGMINLQANISGQ
ncbi:MAG: hypothetical protein A2735_00815 [Candidatus Yanofskybacteria bacterium RIFCSPHIGHO2_01_FULL_41_21]|uniref:Uncharacterized protein n=1 Tax=Candidatus Yanofskybacteria bacterium RIFCSPHIGHO2_01_FULL_41_21 TaxID=1802660 RepID=A0A1F8EAP2_9BACT|nr:MAG: hypothetical protein A2735_00815 [Candidatus Yanofskybacteria bacterium RIFCSPHIGHO2_01_FULL_41_21]